MPEDMTGQNSVTAWTSDKSTLTIAAGVVTPTLPFHIIAAETGVTDDLDEISVASIPGPSDADGYRLVIRAQTGHTITLRHNVTPASANKLLLPDGANIVLASEEALALVYDVNAGTNGAWLPERGDASAVGHTHAYGPDSADYLVGSAQAGLSAEIVVGATPGGELGGTWASPTVDATHSGSAHDKAHVIVFVFPDETLSAAVFMPRPSFRLLSKLPTPTAEGNQRFTATAGTVGAGTNTIVLESSTDRTAWTVRATLALNAATEISTSSFGGWTWAPATQYLRVRCSAVGTAPKDVHAIFEYD